MKTDPTRIPQRTDTADQWIVWYDSLKNNFGKKTANQLFTKAWGLRGSTDLSTNTLREHLKKNGVELPSTWGQQIIDKGADVTDFFGDIFHVGKYVGISLAVIMVGGIGLAIYNIAKNPAQSAGVALKAAV